MISKKDFPMEFQAQLSKTFNYVTKRSRKKKSDNTRFYAFADLTFYSPSLPQFMSKFAYDVAKCDPWKNAQF